MKHNNAVTNLTRPQKEVNGLGGPISYNIFWAVTSHNIQNTEGCLIYLNRSRPGQNLVYRCVVYGHCAKLRTHTKYLSWHYCIFFFSCNSIPISLCLAEMYRKNNRDLNAFYRVSPFQPFICLHLSYSVFKYTVI